MILGRTCDWCLGPIPAGARSDTVTCSKRCRQARHRFIRGTGSPPPATRGHARRLAYADPPYPGMSARYYADHPDFAGEVDHAELIRRLSIEYDAWALSTSAAALRDVLILCPPGTRVAAWVRGERPNAGATGPQNAWEPVVYGGRLARPVAQDLAAGVSRPVADDVVDLSPGSPRRVDALVYASRPRRADPNRVIGSKPAHFCGWLFRLLGAEPGDELVDLYPGSGGVARAWRVYAGHSALSDAADEATEPLFEVRR